MAVIRIPEYSAVWLSRNSGETVGPDRKRDLLIETMLVSVSTTGCRAWVA